MDQRFVRAQVIQKSPVLGEILQKYGSDSILKYVRQAVSPKVGSERKQPVLEVVREITAEFIDPGLAERAVAEFSAEYTVSTAEHHGPLVHPFWVGSNVARAYARKSENKKFIYIFACGGISMSNSSFPRGVLYHNEKGSEERVLFVPWRDRGNPVFGYPAYTQKVTEKAWKGIADQHILKDILPIYAQSPAYKFAHYADQVTYTNYHLWRKIPGLEDVHVLNFQQEDVVNRLLIEHHLPQKTLVCELITQEKFLTAYQKFFDGIPGAFSGTKKGTFLFWLLREGVRESLLLDGTQLVTHDGTYALALEAEAIRVAIEKKEIFPSMALMFIVCAFYHGITCSGGFSQVTYLGEMKRAYVNVLRDVGASEEEISVAERALTDVLSEDMLYLFYEINGRKIPATAVDLILKNSGDSEKKIMHLLETCTLTDALDQMMPELHKIYYGIRTEAPPFKYPSL